MLRQDTIQAIKDALKAERKHLSERPLLTLGQQSALKAMIKHFPNTVGAANAQQRLDSHNAVKPAYALIGKIEALIEPKAARTPQKSTRRQNRRGTLRDAVRAAIIENGALASAELRQVLTEKNVQHTPSSLATLLSTSPMFEHGGDGKWRIAIDMQDEAEAAA